MSNRIRSEAERVFVLPARRDGRRTLSIAVRDMMLQLGPDGKGTQSLCCSALRDRSFLRRNGLTLEAQEGPPSGRGSSTIYHYAIDPEKGQVETETRLSHEEAAALAERYLAPLRGLLAEEIRSMGGTEAYMRWVRSNESGA